MSNNAGWFIVKHRKNPKLKIGICTKQYYDKVQIQSSQIVGQPPQIQPVIFCAVSWDESIVNPETGEITFPPDEARLPASVLHISDELIFIEPFTPEAPLNEEAEEALEIIDWMEENMGEQLAAVKQAIVAMNEESEGQPDQSA